MGIYETTAEYLDLDGGSVEWNIVPRWTRGLATCAEFEKAGPALNTLSKRLYRQPSVRARSGGLYVGSIALAKWGL